MTLQECYTALNGDYAGVIERLKKEGVAARFVKMFAHEDFYTKLESATAAGDTEAAFRAAHLLKGNCMSLGFTQLQKLSEDITEELRNGRTDEAKKLLKPLAEEYQKTIAVIRQLKN